MTLNGYRDEVKGFLLSIGARNEGTDKKLLWLEDEYQLLKSVAETGETDNLRHQIYDMLFILLEIAAENEFDLDSEWEKGRQKKEENYTSSGSL